MRRRRLLSSETDRNTASPTESAVWRRRGREHSGADRLNAKIIDQWISVGLYGLHTLRAWVGKDTDHECFVVLFFSMRVVPRNNKRTLFRPGIQRSILRAFFCLFQSQGNSKKYANHACMNEYIFKNFFGEKPHRDGV